MSILDNTALFAAVIQQGGFSHAAKFLGLSNGLVSRRIAQLEQELGVTLIKRTTRQLQLTPEGELLWQHAQRIQQELNAAISVIQSLSKKPKGMLRISAPPFFGRHYLTPILMKFLNHFNEIEIDLILSHQRFDLIKEELDLAIRGVGYLDKPILKDSTMQMKLLLKERIGIYASPDYLAKCGEPDRSDALGNHVVINYVYDKHLPDQAQWDYSYKNEKQSILLNPKFSCNDIESSLSACIAGYGIGRFTELHVKEAIKKQQLRRILTDYDWGCYHLYAIYPYQQTLPKRTRLLLDFIQAHTENF